MSDLTAQSRLASQKAQETQQKKRSNVVEALLNFETSPEDLIKQLENLGM